MRIESAPLRFWMAFGGVMLAVLVGLQINQWQKNHALMINVSESLPNWAFFISTDRNVEKGDIVFFVPPESKVLEVHFKGDESPFGKHVLGVAGDTVSHDGNRVFVNGGFVGKLKPYSSKGLVLTPGPEGEVPEGCIYAGTAHDDGFDSRYSEIGFVCRNQIIGKGVAIL